jgi:Domain of unknown function (DUF1996)
MRLLLILALALTLAPLAQAETHEGTFIVRDRTAPFKIRAADPIVSPGVFPSAHSHTFFCSRSVDENSTLESLLADATGKCSVPADTTPYWMQTLLDANGNPVAPRVAFAYYKTIPTSYRTTQPFPNGLKFIADGSYPTTAFWDCFDNSPSGKYDHPLHCATDELQERLIFTNCWDGWQLDTPNHRDHVVRPVSGACPASHPVKLPRVTVFFRYPTGSGGPGWHLSSFAQDGIDVPHGDIFVAWQPGSQEALVSRCLNAGLNCGVVVG